MVKVARPNQDMRFDVPVIGIETIWIAAEAKLRVIAVDTGGVAPKDHVISSSKSEPGKTEGVFTLSKPTSGFPPGKYRVELRQANKLIYSEEFTVR